MRRSHIVLPVHIVWATYQRMPLITPECEEALFHCIATEVVRLKCELIAINGMPDHVHLAILLPATVTVANVMKQVKGASSHFVTEHLMPKESFFYWQEGYSAYGFHINLAPRVVAYIQNQKQHHAAGTTWPTLEKIGEEVPEIKSLVRENGVTYGRTLNPTSILAVREDVWARSDPQRVVSTTRDLGVRYLPRRQ